MLTIRLKGKYLVLAFTLVILLTGLLYAATARAVSVRDLAKAEQEGDMEKYLDILQQLYPDSEEAAKKIYFSAQEETSGLPDYQGNMIYIFPSGNYWSGSREETSLEIAIAKLTLLREQYPQVVWSRHALRELANCYYAAGDYEQAKVYALTSIRETEWEDVQSVLLLARIYLDQGDYRAAFEAAEKSLQNKPGYLTTDMLYIQARAMAGLRNWETAEKLFKRLPGAAAEMSPDFGEDDRPVRADVTHWKEVSRRGLERIEQIRQTTGWAAVRGKIMLGEKTFAGARVYLVDCSVGSDYFSTAETAEMRQVVSADDGSFYFDKVLPGRYALAVGVRIPDVEGYTLQHQPEVVVTDGGDHTQNLQFVPIATVQEPTGGKVLDDIVEFAWRAVDGAAYYDLSVTNIWRGEGNMASYSSVLRSKITDNRLVIHLNEELAKARFNPSYGHSDSTLNPFSVFGQIYRGGEFAWYVTAYDADGRKINDSNGYGRIVGEKQLPLFKIAGEFTEADKLVWALKYEQAIAAYEEVLAATPNDTHALLMLARINHFGIRPQQSDWRKAAYYYERLLAVEDTPELRKALAGVYGKIGQTQKAYDLYQSLIGTRAEAWDTHYNLAKADYRLGRPADALDRLKAAVAMDHGQYVRSYPVVLALVLDDADTALWFADSVDAGQQYKDLLVQYLNEGYTVPGEVLEAVTRGNYDEAAAVLSNEPHGRFLQGLLLYLGGETKDSVESEIAWAMDEGMLRNLLLNLMK